MKIKICITSDLHGRIDCLQNIAVLVDEIQPHLLIDNGDFLQGSMSSYYYHYVNSKLHPMISLANDMNYDVAIFGNHEFNFPKPWLEKLRLNSNFPWIACNLNEFAEPYFIKTIENIKIAIIGAVTQATPRWDEQGFTQHIQFQNAYDSILSSVQYVQTHEHPDIIIVSYHGGFSKCPNSGAFFAKDDNENEANAICQIPGVDLCITGHQHLQIISYNNTPSIQVGSNGQFLGYIEIDSTTKQLSMELIPAQKSNSNPIEVDEWLKTMIGYTEYNFTFNSLLQFRSQPHPLVDVLHQVQLQHSNAQLSILELGFTEQGGFKGTITNEDILHVFRRENLLHTAILYGEDLYQLLENNAMTFAINDLNELDFAFNVLNNNDIPYLYYFLSGVEYTLNITMPPGKRVENLLYKGRKVKKTDQFTVACNSYLTTGSDLSFFKKRQIIHRSDVIIPEIIRQFIKENNPLPLYNHSHFNIGIKQSNRL